MTAPDGLPGNSAPASARRYAVVFRWTIVVIVVLWFGAIAIVDPRREYLGSRFPAVVPNTRAEKLERLAEYARHGPVDALVMGSSRSFALAPEDLRARGLGRSFSLTVHGGGVQDLVALYRMTRAMGIRPRVVVIGVDETWLGTSFKDAYELQHNRLLQGALNTGERPPSRVWHAFALAERTMTPSYAMDAVRSVRGWLSSAPPRMITDSAGYTWEPGRDAEIASGSPEAMVPVSRSVAFLVPPLVAYGGVDSVRANLMVEFLRELEEDTVKVLAFLTPYHPVALQALNSRPRALAGFQRARADMMATFARAGVPLHDLSDAASFGASEREWYDAFHMQSPNAARLLDVLISRGL